MQENGIAAVKGWTESTGVVALDLARRAEDAGAGTIIYTDIATDGMLQGPNLREIEKVLGAIGCQLIASGGFRARRMFGVWPRFPRLYGCIIGKALYDGTVHLRQLASLVHDLSAHDLSTIR
jgi:phosphoribosylformimino-5-aminoimidazole carboxamide ribotide isomerase